MGVDYRFRRYWRRVSSERQRPDIDAIQKFLWEFGQRDSESKSEFHARLDAESAAYMAEADRQEQEDVI